MKKYLIVFLLFTNTLVLFLLNAYSKDPKTKAPVEVKPSDSAKIAEPSILYDWTNRKRPIPDEKVFQTKYLGGTQIVFNHKLHEHDLKIQCIECHHVESCSHCHQKEVTRWDVQESKVVLHESCFTCHSNKNCTACHKK
ncbi:MAG: cytochrome c family protein [bacterium]|nr:cytochrome c family protein [bacterium]